MDEYKAIQDTWNKLAQAYQDKFMDLDSYDHTYDAFCNKLPKQAQVFEIGCGPGNITRYLLKARPDLNIEAIDTSPEMIRLAEANNPAAEFRVMDGRNIGSVTKTFHGIVCGFCLPYLTKEDVAQLVKDCSHILKKDGVLYLSLIEDRYDRSEMQTGSTGDSIQVYYHEEGYLRGYLQENDFDAIETFRIHYPKADGTMQVHLVLIARIAKAA